MTELEKQRLEDFKVILRYHLCSKIKKFNCTPKQFYAARALYEKFKRDHAYNKRVFELIAFVNASGLSRHQVQSIFGYVPSPKGTKRVWINYKELIASDSSIAVRNHGTQFCKTLDKKLKALKGITNSSKTEKKARRAFSKCYFLPYEEIAKVFEDEELLDKVLDITSDLYTPRQRCIIFNQIIGVRRVRDSEGNLVIDKGKVKLEKHVKARYKSNKQIVEETKAAVFEPTEEDIDELINDLD